MKTWDEIIRNLHPNETIISGIVGKLYFNDEWNETYKNYIKKLVTPDILEKMLQMEWDSGYGEENVPPFIIWTNERIFIVSDYDGALSLVTIPRNPTETKDVEYAGGG